MNFTPFFSNFHTYHAWATKLYVNRGGTGDNERGLLKDALAKYALWLVNKNSATLVFQPIAVFQCHATKN